MLLVAVKAKAVHGQTTTIFRTWQRASRFPPRTHKILMNQIATDRD
jgi:hypothetical protein